MSFLFGAGACWSMGNEKVQNTSLVPGGREKCRRRPECEGSGVSKSSGDEPKAPRPETKNERRRREKEELLFSDGRDAFEAYLSQNSQRPKQPD
jgi:hypothetical protein